PMKRVLLLFAFLSQVSGTRAHDEKPHDAGHAKPATAAHADRAATKETTFGRAADPASALRTILVEMRDTYEFSPSQIDVRTGEIVRFVVVNAGRKMHEMVLGTMADLAAHNDQMKKDP